MADLYIDAQVENLADLRRFVREEAAALGAEEEAICDLELAVDEAACNIIRHGYDRPWPACTCSASTGGRQGRQDRRGGIIQVAVERDGDRLIIRLRDQAPPFDPTRHPLPDVTLPLEQRKLGGLGIFLILKSVDQVTYRIPPEGGNELTLVKRLPSPQPLSQRERG